MINIQTMQKSYADEAILSWAACVAAETNTTIYQVVESLYQTVIEIGQEN